MAVSSFPPVCLGAIVAVTLSSTLAMASDAARQYLLLTPGNTVLGDHSVWNVVTGYLVDMNGVKLLLSLGAIALLASRAEPTSVRSMSTRVLLALVFAVAGTGLLISFTSVILYLGSGHEPYLYAPIYGTGPVVIALAVAAHQVAGDSPLAPEFLPVLAFSHMPLVALLTIAVCSRALEVSTDLTSTAISWVLTWMYLRFLHVYEGGAVGDKRDEFEFLSMLPSFLRTPLRPFIKLLSAIFLRLPVFSRATGDGMKALPLTFGAQFKGSSHSTDGASAGTLRPAADPVAERRRERALAALDKKLAEMRVSMRAGPAPMSASSTSLSTAAGATSAVAAAPASAPNSPA